MSLEPGVAALAAMILLPEFLHLTQWIALACVVIASVGATRTPRRRTTTPGLTEPRPTAPFSHSSCLLRATRVLQVGLRRLGSSVALGVGVGTGLRRRSRAAIVTTSSSVSSKSKIAEILLGPPGLARSRDADQAELVVPAEDDLGRRLPASRRSR